MSIGSGKPISPALGWVQEWQRLCRTALNRSMGHYLQGCADVAMTRTPHQALAALQKMQAGLIRHAVDTTIHVTGSWRR